MSYTAIIIEPRKHKALSFVLNNFLTNLSDDWVIILYHGTDNLNYVTTIINRDLSQFKDRIILRNLNVANLTIKDYDALLKSAAFYEAVPTEMFLIFQTDTMIFAKYRDLINQFMQYDYVGAPWNQRMFWTRRFFKVGNGGLSLRRKSKMLEIIEKEDAKPTYHEDAFVSHPDKVSINKPTIEEAKLFAIESIFSDKTFGCHKPWVNLRRQVFNCYPESKALFDLQGVET